MSALAVFAEVGQPVPEEEPHVPAPEIERPDEAPPAPGENPTPADPIRARPARTTQAIAIDARSARVGSRQHRKAAEEAR